MGAGASQALEDIVAQRILAQKLQAEIQNREQQAAMEQQRIDESIRSSKIDEGQRAQQLEMGDRDRRDRSNARGMDLMKDDRAGMDLEAAMGSLPAHLKPLGPSMKAGLVGKLSPEDLQSPEDRTNVLKADEERQIRIRRASQPLQPRVVTMPDGTIKDLNNVLPPGAVPYDPVAARSSKPEDRTEAVDTAREAQRIASALKDHPGFGGAFGVVSSMIPTVKQSTADAESLRDALTSLLTLENMGKMKGVLSDSDMKVLRQASTTLNSRMGDSMARSELNRIIQVMGKVSGGESAPLANTTPTHKFTIIRKE